MTTRYPRVYAAYYGSATQADYPLNLAAVGQRTQLSHVPVTDPAGVAMDPARGWIFYNSGGTAFRLRNTDVSRQALVTFMPAAAFSADGSAVTHAAYTVPPNSTAWLGKHDVMNFGSIVLIVVDSPSILIT